jgi:hypothetical protein
MDKVFQTVSHYEFGLGRRIRVSCAGREFESAQLVVIPTQRDLKSVRVSASDLYGPSGNRLPTTAISLHLVGYVRTQPSNSALRRCGWMWPEVLMPLKPFEVSVGNVQPVWVTVHVPDGTPPGAYRSMLTVATEGAKPQEALLEVQVRGFSLPVRGRLKTAFCTSPGMWEMWHKPEEVATAEGTKSIGHGYHSFKAQAAKVVPDDKWKELYQFLLDHRISPSVIYSGIGEEGARTVPPRADLEWCYERGQNTICLGSVDVGQADHLDWLEKHLRPWQEFIRETNWPDMLFYVHGFDESEMRPADQKEKADEAIRKICTFVHEKFPEIKRESANPVTDKHTGLFDIFTPLTAQYKHDVSVERRKAGDQVWVYVCCGPGKPYANYFVDNPGLDPRILGWQLFKYRIEGLLYYLTNLYAEQPNWDAPGPKWPEVPWNPKAFGVNGDGQLFYPGPNMTPLASTRLENTRDGIEDYEYLALLEDLAGRLPDAEQTRPLLQEIRETLAVRPAVTADFTQYTQEPATLRAERDRVADLIEKAKAAAGTAGAG